MFHAFAEDYRVEPDGTDATLLRWTMACEPRLAFKLARPFLRPVLTLILARAGHNLERGRWYSTHKQLSKSHKQRRKDRGLMSVVSETNAKAHLATIEVRNPADGKMVGEVPNESAQAVEAKVRQLRLYQPSGRRSARRAVRRGC